LGGRQRKSQKVLFVWKVLRELRRKMAAKNTTQTEITPLPTADETSWTASKPMFLDLNRGPRLKVASVT
jgi:hypothetical protein